MEERKFAQMVLVTWPRWPPCPYMVKTLKKSSLELKGQWPWNLVCNIVCSSITKFAQMTTPSWPWPILWQGQLCPLCVCIGKRLVGWLCWGLTSQSTIFQSYRDGAIASWVINQYFRGVKCLAQGHNTAAVGLEPRTSRSGVRHSTTEPPRSPLEKGKTMYFSGTIVVYDVKVGR